MSFFIFVLCPSPDHFGAWDVVVIVGKYLAHSGVTGAKTHLPPHIQYTTWWPVIVGMRYYISKWYVGKFSGLINEHTLRSHKPPFWFGPEFPRVHFENKAGDHPRVFCSLEGTWYMMQCCMTLGYNTKHTVHSTRNSPVFWHISPLCVDSVKSIYLYTYSARIYI